MQTRRLRSAAGWIGGLALVMGLGGPARAVPLVGDQTIVLLTSAGLLAGAGISVAPIGAAEIGLDLAERPEALFPITGGDVTGLAGTIEHDGSGLLLAQGATELPLTNFLIDTTALVLSGDTPLGNVPPRIGHDPHDDTPKIPAVQLLKDGFWHRDGVVNDVCAGAPCTGPQF